MHKKTIRDIDLKGKRALVRVDYNVPLDNQGKVENDNRIKATLPTINYLLEHEAKVILVTHAGRPEGQVVENMRTTDIARALSDLLGKDVKKVDDCIGEKVKEAVDQMKAGEILLLENVRFYPGEEANDPEFAKKLAANADIFVNDGFAVCHRDQASVTGVTKFLPSVAGFLVEKEVDTLTEVRDNPEKPLIVVMGGVKLETRIPMIEQFLEKADKILFGGAMIFTFFKAQGMEVGKSIVDENYLDKAKELLEKYGEKLIFPVDVVVGEKLEEGVETKGVSIKEVPTDMMGLDIGPDSVKKFSQECQEAKTIIWNGPMGAFEIKPFDKGTCEFADEISKLDAKTVIGGGDTAAALEEACKNDKMDFVSTGGGASLTLLEGLTLPGVEALEDK